MWLLPLWGIIWVYMLFLVKAEQFTSKIDGRLRRPPPYSSGSVWHGILWLVDHWSVAEKQIRASSRVSSSAYSGSGPTATMIPGSCCFCYTNLPNTPCFFPSHSLLQCPKRPPAPLLQPSKERSFFILCGLVVSLKPPLCYLIHIRNHIYYFFE